MGKQAFRVIETRGYDNRYNMLEIQLLDVPYNAGVMGTISSFGSITFQQNIGESVWYGKRYELSTTYLKDINLFQKVAKKIEAESDWNSQPGQIIDILAGEKYFICRNEFFKESDKGKYCFDVMRDNSLICRLVAKDVAEAVKKTKKFQEIRKYSQDLIVGDKFLIE